jgi:hypothetical protein
MQLMNHRVATRLSVSSTHESGRCNQSKCLGLRCNHRNKVYVGWCRSASSEVRGFSDIKMGANAK